MNGAAAMAEILKREGTEFLSCYPRNPVIEEGAKIGIRPILCRQERVGVGIADGFTRIMRGRKNGVFAAQAGPGIENAFPGIAQAYAENVPILIIAGGQRLDRQYTRPTFGAAEVYKPITKWAARIHDVKQIPDIMRRAYHALRSGKGGPVLLEVPDEVWNGELAGPLDYTPVGRLRAGPDPKAIEDAARILTEAENPIVFAGQGVLYADASDELVKFAMALPAPVMTTNPGKSAFPESHPLSLGASTSSAPRPLFDYMKKADVVFAIGSSLTRTPFGPGVPAGKRIVHATNHEDDINKDYRVECGVVGDAKLVLEALNAEIGRDRRRRNPKRDAESLGKEVRGAKEAWRKEWMGRLTSSEVPINPYRVLWDLMNTADRDKMIVTHDSGSPREQTIPLWECTVAGSYMGWGKSTQLGYGLGINMGAKLAAPDKLCVNFMGASAIGMTGMDLETAARNDIATLTIVLNNGVMAAERDVLKVATERYGALTVGGNYSKVAEGLGVASVRVEAPDGIVPGIKKAIDTVHSGKPFLLEFLTKQNYEFSRYS